MEKGGLQISVYVSWWKHWRLDETLVRTCHIFKNIKLSQKYQELRKVDWAWERGGSVWELRGFEERWKWGGRTSPSIVQHLTSGKLQISFLRNFERQYLYGENGTRMCIHQWKYDCVEEWNFCQIFKTSTFTKNLKKSNIITEWKDGWMEDLNIYNKKCKTRKLIFFSPNVK